MDKNVTLAQLRDQIISSVANESNTKYYYRLRRIASRKNHTKRPMQFYVDADYEKPLADLGIDKKSYIYLEQDTDESKTF